MAWPAIERFCGWLRPRKRLLLGVMRVAAEGMAAGIPVPGGGIAVKLVGELAEYGVERLLKREAIRGVKHAGRPYPSEQLKEVNNYLGKLTEAYKGLLDELEKRAGNGEDHNLTSLIREMLRDRADLQLPFAAFTEDVQGMALSLRGIEASLSRIKDKVDQVHDRFDDLILQFPGFQEFQQLSPPVRQALLQSARLFRDGQPKKGAFVLIGSLPSRGIGRQTVLRIVESIYPIQSGLEKAAQKCRVPEVSLPPQTYPHSSSHQPRRVLVAPAPDHPRQTSPHSSSNPPRRNPPLPAKASGASHCCNGHMQAVTCVAFSPNSKHVLSGSEDGTVRIWEVKTGKPLLQLVPWPPITYPRGLEEYQMRGVLAVAFSDDGLRAVGVFDAGLILAWDVQTGREVSRIGPDKDLHYKSFRFSPQKGQYEYLSGLSYTEELHVYFSHAYISADGRAVLIEGTSDSSTDPCLALYDLQRGEERGTPDGYSFLPEVYDLFALNHDGALAAFVRNGDEETGQISGYIAVDATPIMPRCRSDTYSDLSMAAAVKCLAVSHDNRFLLLGTEQGQLHLFDATTCQEVRYFGGHTGAVGAVAFTRDSRSAVSGGEDNTVRAWHVETGELLACNEGHTAPITSVAYSPDGRWIASGSSDKTLRIWPLLPGKERKIKAKRF